MIKLHRPSLWITISVVTAILLLLQAVDMKVLPSPLSVLSAIPDLWSHQGLGMHLYTSLTLNLEASIGMVVVSIGLAYICFLPLGKSAAQFFSFGRFNSFVGLPFALTILIGNEHWTKVALLTIAMSVFAVPSLIDIVESTPLENHEDAICLGMKQWRRAWEVSIRGNVPAFIDTLRTNWAMGWVMLPFVEGRFRDEGGIGVLLLMNDKYLALDHVYAAIIVVGLAGVGIDRVILEIKKIMCPYAFMK